MAGGSIMQSTKEKYEAPETMVDVFTTVSCEQLAACPSCGNAHEDDGDTCLNCTENYA